MAVVAERRCCFVHLHVTQIPFRCIGDEELAGRWRGFRLGNINARGFRVQQGALPLSLRQDVGWNGAYTLAPSSAVLPPFDEVFSFKMLLGGSVDENVIPVNVSVGALYNRREAPAVGVLDVLYDVDALGVGLGSHTVHLWCPMDSIVDSKVK